MRSVHRKLSALEIDKETNIKYNTVYGIDALLNVFKPTKDAG
jgi:hypothetical protein